MKKKKASEPMLGTKKQRFEVILEDMHSDIKIIAEQSSAHTEQLDSIDRRLEKIEEDVAIIKIDLEFIKSELKQKVNRDEFTVLERRLSLLENKVSAQV